MNVEIELLHEKLNKLDKDMQTLCSMVETLQRTIDNNISPKCDKMGNHIDFIDDVYKTVKHPLEFVCRRVSSLTHKNPNASFPQKQIEN